MYVNYGWVCPTFDCAYKVCSLARQNKRMTVRGYDVSEVSNWSLTLVNSEGYSTYLVCPSVCLSVCLSVYANSRSTGYEAAYERYQQLEGYESMKIEKAIFLKRLRSRDMACTSEKANIRAVCDRSRTRPRRLKRYVNFPYTFRNVNAFH